MATKSGSASEEPNTCACGVCNNEVVIKEKRHTGVKWFCKVCQIHFSKVKLEIKIVEERQVVVEAKQVTFEAGLMDVRRELGALKQELKDFVKVKEQKEEKESEKVEEQFDEIKTEIKNIRKSYSDTVVSGNAVTGELVRSNTTAQNRDIKVEVSELMERDKRKNNLVIFGIEETNDEFVTKDKVNEIVRAVGLEENKIKYFGRVGRMVPGAKPRIVRVVCQDSETKRKFLKESNRLKSIEGFANKYEALDLTKVQEIQDKNLREKLKEFRVRDKDARINN